MRFSSPCVLLSFNQLFFHSGVFILLLDACIFLVVYSSINFSMSFLFLINFHSPKKKNFFCSIVMSEFLNVLTLSRVMGELMRTWSYFLIFHKFLEVIYLFQKETLHLLNNPAPTTIKLQVFFSNLNYSCKLFFSRGLNFYRKISTNISSDFILNYLQSFQCISSY